ncbi:MAG: hypothetical protein JWN43_2878 [Gammaproteobacteria bacterium]|nr:hypothetical protein [Gammaproteobacteria bacterium]
MTSGAWVVAEGVSARFGRRFAALIYDCFLLFALLMVFTALSLVFTQEHRAVTPASGGWFYVYRAGELAVIAGYYIVNWMRSGQTLGMRAWRLRTVSAAGKPLQARAAVLRFLCGFLAWPPAALGVLWLYLDPEHLAIHDRLSKTRVVRLRAPD